MNTLPITRRQLVAASCTMWLAGCSLLPNPPAPQMYRLSPVGLDPADSPAPHGDLAIAMPTAPGNLDSDRIALTRGATRFDYFAASTWTDRVPALLQTLLVEAFETDGRIANVWTDSDAMTAGYMLQTQVRAFTARYDDAAANPPVVDVSLATRLVCLPGNRMVGQALLAEQSTATQNKLKSVVRAFDVATAKVLNRCVAWTLHEMQS